MPKRYGWALLLWAVWAFGGEGMPAQKKPLADCLACHATTAPPLSLVYRRYLMLYSAKEDVADKMAAFLAHPSKAASSMPEGMKNRFNPQLHPVYTPQEAQAAARAVVEKEDILKRIVVP
ncbi:hypothetical protein [Hydrogenimonas sp.]